MTVQDMMRKSPRYCTANMSLAEVTERLWLCGCGALPVVDVGKNVVGIITDRDICVALGTRDRRPSELMVEQAMSRQVAICNSSDEIHTALDIMKKRKVRRVPVVGNTGQLEGILCLSDLILQARHDDGSDPELSYEDVICTLKGIYWHHSILMVPLC